MRYEETTSAIIRSAFEVHNELGFGYLESVYQKSLLVELGTTDLSVESEREIGVEYKGQPVGEFRADLLVEGTVIVEIKSVRELVDRHEVQLVNYLQATGKEVGLLVNFGPGEVDVCRKVRDLEQLSSD